MISGRFNGLLNKLIYLEARLDNITTSVGAIVVVFELCTFYARIKTPEKFAKLQATREEFGQGVGTAAHTIAYSALPLIFGGAIVNVGLNGGSLLDLIAA